MQRSSSFVRPAERRRHVAVGPTTDSRGSEEPIKQKRLNSFYFFQPRCKAPPQPASCARTCSPLSSLPDCSSAIHDSPAHLSRLFLPVAVPIPAPFLSASCLPWVAVVLFSLSFFLENDSCCGPFFLKEEAFVVVVFVVAFF